MESRVCPLKRPGRRVPTPSPTPDSVGEPSLLPAPHLWGGRGRGTSLGRGAPLSFVTFLKPMRKSSRWLHQTTATSRARGDTEGTRGVTCVSARSHPGPEQAGARSCPPPTRTPHPNPAPSPKAGSKETHRDSVPERGSRRSQTCRRDINEVSAGRSHWALCWIRKKLFFRIHFNIPLL